MPRPVAAASALGESSPSSRTTVSRRTTACTTADRKKPRISAQRISHVIDPAIARAWYSQPIGALPPALGAFEPVELAAHRRGVGVVQLGEDGQRLLPRVAGSAGLLGAVVAVAEVVEDHPLVEPVTDVADHLQGVPVGVDRLRVPAEGVVGVADTVPGGRLPGEVAELLEDREYLFGVGQRPGEVAEQRVAPADRVERLGLAGALPRDPVQLESAQRVVEPLGVPAAQLHDVA